VRPIRIALTKGRLEKDTVAAFEKIGYDCERDLRNPSGSVFCAHGAGFVVPWDEVADYMHLPSVLVERKVLTEEEIMERARSRAQQNRSKGDSVSIGTDEIDSILQKTFYANQKSGFIPHKGISGRKTKAYKAETATVSPEKRVYAPREKKQEYLLVDGYNIIFAWDDLKALAQVNLDGARGRLLDILCNYQGIRGCELIAVFDAYRLEGHPEEVLTYHNIRVVYTKEAETADRYIEKFAHQNAKKYDVTVATSDGLEQIIIRGAGCRLLSARELREEIEGAGKRLMENYEERAESGKQYLLDGLSKEALETILSGQDESTRVDPKK